MMSFDSDKTNNENGVKNAGYAYPERLLLFGLVMIIWRHGGAVE